MSGLCLLVFSLAIDVGNHVVRVCEYNKLDGVLWGGAKWELEAIVQGS